MTEQGRVYQSQERINPTEFSRLQWKEVSAQTFGNFSRDNIFSPVDTFRLATAASGSKTLRIMQFAPQEGLKVFDLLTAATANPQQRLLNFDYVGGIQDWAFLVRNDQALSRNLMRQHNSSFPSFTQYMQEAVISEMDQVAIGKDMQKFLFVHLPEDLPRLFEEKITSDYQIPKYFDGRVTVVKDMVIAMNDLRRFSSERRGINSIHFPEFTKTKDWNDPQKRKQLIASATQRFRKADVRFQLEFIEEIYHDYIFIDPRNSENQRNKFLRPFDYMVENGLLVLKPRTSRSEMYTVGIEEIGIQLHPTGEDQNRYKPEGITYIRPRGNEKQIRFFEPLIPTIGWVEEETPSGIHRRLLSREELVPFFDEDEGKRIDRVLGLATCVGYSDDNLRRLIPSEAPFIRGKKPQQIVGQQIGAVLLNATEQITIPPIYRYIEEDRGGFFAKVRTVMNI